MSVKKILITSLAIIMCAGSAATYLYARKVAMDHAPDDPVEKTVVSNMILSSNEDHSAFASPTVDANNMMHVPDNTAIALGGADGVTCRYFSIRVPSRWKDNVVVKTSSLKTIDHEDDQKYSPVFVLQIFDKQTYEKYRTQEYINEEGSQKKGKITEIYFAPISNDLSAIDGSARQMHFATVSMPNGEKYHAYLLQISPYSGTVDSERLLEMTYLMDVDYANAIAKSFTPIDGTKSYPNTYIEACALAYQEDDQPSAIPSVYTPTMAQPYTEVSPVSVKEPPLSGNGQTVTYYEFTDFSSPWAYLDRGNDYPYAEQESGALPPANLTTGYVSGDHTSNTDTASQNAAPQDTYLVPDDTTYTSDQSDDVYTSDDVFIDDDSYEEDNYDYEYDDGDNDDYSDDGEDEGTIIWE